MFSQLGLGSIIFNRRGRLDVKKPGPFYPKSANNFFFDKVDYDAEDYQDRRNDTVSSSAAFSMFDVRNALGISQLGQAEGIT